MLKSKEYGKNGFYLEAVCNDADEIKWFRVQHKSGWDWVTHSSLDLETQRKEIRDAALFDVGVPLDTSQVQSYIHFRDKRRIAFFK